MFPLLFLPLLLFSTSRADDLSPCSKGQGAPGGLYTCPLPDYRATDSKQCHWHEPDTCVTWGISDEPPRSIGPDASGICALYYGENCSGEVLRFVRCPGINNFASVEASNETPGGSVRSIKCVKDGGRGYGDHRWE